MIRLFNGNFYINQAFKKEIYINDHGIITEASEHVTRSVDMNGQFIYPGFIDCHLHIMGYGQHLSRLTVEHIYEKEAVLRFISQHVVKPYTYIESYHPIGITRHELDLLSQDTPIYLRHADFHGMTVNSVVLKVLNIESETGILLEDDATFVLQSIPKQSKEVIKLYIKKAYEALHAFGIVSGQSDDLYYFNGFEETTDAFLEVSKEIPFYAHLLVHHKTLKDYELSNKRDVLNTFISLGAVKMFYDGTTTSRTALMNVTYDDGTYGVRIQDRLHFESLVMASRALSLPVAVHVIGDLGLKEVAEILKKYPVKKGLYDRVIHASYCHQAALDILKEIDVFLDLQPQFITTDFPHTFKLFQTLPDMIFPFKTYHDAGLNYGLSSDAPVEIPNPLLGIHAAVTRTNKQGTYQIEQSLTRIQAFEGYTKHAWKLTKDRAGTLDTGMLANLVVFDHDILSCPIDDLLTMKVKETWVKGICVYKNT
jgi:predicted amidohydrolase YtcJ